MSRRAYPASPPIYQDPEQLAAQVARTDDALGQWRITSVQRRVAYVAAQKQAEDGMRRRRRRVTLTAVALGLGSSAIAAALVVWQLGWPIPALAAAMERGWDGVAAPVEPVAVVAPDAAPAPVDSVAAVVSAATSGATEIAAGTAEAAAPTASPDAPATESVPADPVPADPVPADAPPVADGGGAGLANLRVWRDDVHQWAGFDTTATGLVQFKYLDGAGDPVLEPMGCPRKVVDGVRRCTAGRTLDRLRHAVDVGAAAGAWSVLGCVDAVCDEVGRFDVP
jgi:hypothetical protein